MKPQVTAGMTWDWPVEVAGYTSADWALKLVLRPLFTSPTQAPITIQGVADGANWRIQATATDTAGYVAGAYAFDYFVERGAERYPVRSGFAAILQNPLTATQGLDTRAFARKALENIEAVLANRASLDQMEFQIAGRMLKRTPIADLLMLRNKLRQEVAAEDAEQRLNDGLGGGSVIRVRL